MKSKLLLCLALVLSGYFWLVTGAGDLAQISTSLQTASRGFVW